MVGALAIAAALTMKAPEYPDYWQITPSRVPGQTGHGWQMPRRLAQLLFLGLGGAAIAKAIALLVSAFR